MEDRRPGRRGGWGRLGAALAAIACTLPLLFMVSGSLRPTDTPPPRSPELVPAGATLANYPAAFDTVDLARQLVNSTVVVAVAVPLTVLVASAAGFAIARLSRRWSRWWVGASLVALMVPSTALIVSRFALFKAIGVTGTLVPLVAPALLGTSPFYVLLFVWSFRRLPTELFDAAALEGAGPWTTWWRVAMPLVRPVTTAVAVLAFAVTWGNLIDPLVYLTDPTTYTAPLGLRELSQLDPDDTGVLLAAAVITTVPVVVVFLALQRSFLGRFRGAGWLGG